MPEVNALFAPAVEMSSLSLFYREVNRQPRLTREDEMRLARSWRGKKDREAAKQLVVSHLHGVAAIAREYRHFGLPEMDLIQEGTLGLMHAVKRFDPDRGFRLMTYASWWIRASIHDFILNSWSIVKLGTSKMQRRIFAGLQKAKNAIAALEGYKADEVGAEFGLSALEYQEVASAFVQRDLSLDADTEGYSVIDSLPAADASPEEMLMTSDWEEKQTAGLYSALNQLPDRDRYIVERRYLSESPSTLKDISEELGVSIERVRQLEKRAMDTIKAKLSN